MKVAVVIGSNSFSGSSFVNFLIKKNFKVVGISRSNQKKECFRLYEKKHKNFIFKKLDINKDITKIIKIIRLCKAKYIINYSSQSMVGQSWVYPEDWFKTNSYSIPFLYNEISKIHGVRLVHISTPEVYGNTKGVVDENYAFNPSTPYAVSRCTADNFLKILKQQKKIDFVSIRAANVYGEGQDGFRIIPKTIISIFNNLLLELHGGGYSTRSFIHIDDVSSATFEIMTKGKSGSIFHVSTDRYIKIKDLVLLINKFAKSKYKMKIKKTKDRVGKDYFYRLDSKRIKRELNWQPKISLENGIKRVIAWYLKYKKNILIRDTIYKHKK